MGLSLRAIAVLAAGVAVTAPSVAALPAATDYVLHEKREHSTVNGLWKRGSRVDADAIIPLRIGLSQSNLHLGYDRLMEVSHPESASFGQHLSAEEVHGLFAPADETFDAVHAWLVEAAGVDASEIRQYENKGWLAVDLPVSVVEEMFMTQYHEHELDGKLKVACDEYSVPGHLSSHIDYIVPGVKMSSPMRKRTVEARSGGPSHNHRGWNPKHIPPWQMPHHMPPPYSPHLPEDVRDCARNMSAACYRALYGIPESNRPIPGNEAGVFESGDTYSQQDLDSYFTKYVPYIPNGTHPTLNAIDGANAPVAATSEFNTGESDIDIDIVQSLIWPQTMVLYQTDDRLYTTANNMSGFLNTFLDALDGSYCHYKADGIKGDSPGIDPAYPDKRPGGYKGPLMCGTYKPTKVISISYGEGELDVPKNYFERQCNEWLKLGLQGHTVLVSSGDYGAGQFAGDDSPDGCVSANGQKGTIYNPGNPVSCPYLTSVGATQLEPGTTVLDAESAMQTPLPGAALFSSAGGFSNYFPAPDYQKAAVKEYFENHDPGHPYYIANKKATNVGENGGIYSRGGRGIPDVSANGATFRAFTNNTDFFWYGTSLAAPLWNSVITLINQERQTIGKRGVGFINPVLYSHTWALNDIKNGSNPNCRSSGFTAVEGWDPVTGLGTPRYPDLLKIWLGLP